MFLFTPVSLLAALFFHSKQNIPALIAPIFKGKTMIWIMFMVTLLICSMKLEYILKKDIPREIAAYLKPKLNEDDVIYTGNYHHIIYYLLKKDSPTKYIHRSLLINENHIRALNIDVDHEFHKIIAANPLYIIIKNEYPEGIMRDFIKANYKLEKDFEGNVQLFRLVMQ